MLLNFLKNPVREFFNFTAPNCKHVPAELAQMAGVFFLVLHIALEFFLPELNIAFGGGGLFAAFVSVPEAAVNKNDGVVFRQDDVGFSRQLFDVFAEAVARAVQHRTDEDFGFGVLTFDARHIPRTSLWSQAVHGGS